MMLAFTPTNGVCMQVRFVDKELMAILGVMVLIMGLLIGSIFWSYQDFANRCERAGGMLMTSDVCVGPDARVISIM
jgi:hypothetical protein